MKMFSVFLALLSLNASASQNLSYYQTATDYFFDPALVDVSSGTAKLKNRTWAGRTFFAAYNQDQNADFFAGSSGVGVLHGSAAISGGGLSLTHTGDYVQYNNTGNCSFGNVFTLEFDIKPLWTGAPTTTYIPFTSRTGHGNTVNGFELKLEPTNGNWGALSFDGTTPTAVAVVNMDVPGIPSSNGTDWYRISFNSDGVNNAHRMFQNGVQQGATGTGTYTKTALPAEWGSGFGINAETYQTNYIIKNVQCFDTIQHTSNYTVPSEVPTPYQMGGVQLRPFNAIDLKTFDGIETFSNEPAGTAVNYLVQTNGQFKYWNGSAWANSDGSYAQSNTIAQIEPNARTLSLPAGGSSLQVVPVLYSTYGRTSPMLFAVGTYYSN